MFRALCNLALTAPLMAASAECTSDECSTDDWDEATFLQLGYNQKKNKATMSPAQPKDDLDDQLARRLRNDFRNPNHTHVKECLATSNWDLELSTACLDEAEAADGIERTEDDAEATDSVQVSLQNLVRPPRHCEEDLPANHPCRCDVVNPLLGREVFMWYVLELSNVDEVQEYAEVCDQLACRLCQYKGDWKFFGSISGNYGTTYSVTWGTEGSESMERAVTEENSEESMLGGSASVTASYDFIASPVGVEATATVETQVTTSFSKAVSNAVGSSTTEHRTQTATRDFLLPGVVWRAEMTLKNTCDESLEIFMDEFAMTANINVHPRCLPGFCQHFGYCCECTDPDYAFVMEGMEGDEECPGPFCAPHQTTAYSFGYRAPERQIGCGQRVEPGAFCSVPCSSLVRGLTGALTLQCDSVTGTLGVVGDGCNLADNDDEGFFGADGACNVDGCFARCEAQYGGSVDSVAVGGTYYCAKSCARMSGPGQVRNRNYYCDMDSQDRYQQCLASSNHCSSHASFIAACAFGCGFWSR